MDVPSATLIQTDVLQSYTLVDQSVVEPDRKHGCVPFLSYPMESLRTTPSIGCSGCWFLPVGDRRQEPVRWMLWLAKALDTDATAFRERPLDGLSAISGLMPNGTSGSGGP